MHRSALLETSWNPVNTLGIYVERGTGDFYRFAKELLTVGGSSCIVKNSRLASLHLELSDDQFVSTRRVGLMCVQRNIESGF